MRRDSKINHFFTSLTDSLCCVMTIVDRDQIRVFSAAIKKSDYKLKTLNEHFAGSDLFLT